MDRRYRITILGCRVNHAEARDMQRVLADRGLRPAATDEPAELEVVHTCSVTNAAAAKSRRAVRRARRRIEPAEPPRAHESGGTEPHVIVTGCLTGTDPGDARTAGADAVVPHDEAARGPEDRVGPSSAAEPGSPMIDRFAAAVDAWLGRPAEATAIAASATPEDRTPAIHPLPVIDPPPGGARHVRAELRIQDGCDAHCTFCVIPRIRRTLRSKRIDDAVAEARRLVDAGHVEIVLSGVFIGAYGHETALRRRQHDPAPRRLADLLDAVASVPGVRRVRISSMEPGDATGPVLEAMLAHPDVVVPHLHLPLQSGSDRILRRMNRQYRVGDYLAMIDEVEAALTRDGLPPAITTDVICGFPGETEADFEATLAVAERVGFLHVHAFPYSERRGTAAARWREAAIPERVRRDRVRRLIALETAPVTGLADRFRRRLLGRRLRVVVEQPDRDRPGHVLGRCDHYAMVTVRSNAPRGTMLVLRASELASDAIVGAEPERAPLPLPVLAAS